MSTWQPDEGRDKYYNNLLGKLKRLSQDMCDYIDCPPIAQSGCPTEVPPGQDKDFPKFYDREQTLLNSRATKSPGEI